METRICNDCGEEKPLTTDYFNSLPGGYFRRVCKECMAANTRRHYYNDPQKVIDRVAKYKDQKNAAEGYNDEYDIQEIRNELGDRCRYCDDELNGGGEIDHMVPVSRGGSNWPSNLTLACRTCNRDKHNKTVEEFINWRLERGLYVRDI